MVEISSDGDFVCVVVFIAPKSEKESGNGENKVHFFSLLIQSAASPPKGKEHRRRVDKKTSPD
tara:strand:+ start:161 stop:349 length:189 start_codon:yes stop_codon:yes gene_type:complete